MKPQSAGPHVPPQLSRTRPCKLAFLAEAPSDEEVSPSRGTPAPLIGPAGRVFNAMLRTAGIDRADCWVGNVFSEKLPSNSVGEWCSGLEARKDWKDYGLPSIGREGYLLPEHQWHLARLQEELEAAAPTVIVPLGGTALWALTGNTSIGAVRGCTQAATLLMPGTKLLPSYHPAYVIKDWRWFTIGVGDFEKALAEAAFPEVKHRSRRLLLCPTLSDLWQYKGDVLDKAEVLSGDIETGWGQVTCIGWGPGPEEAICCPFVDLRRPDRNYWRSAADEMEAWRWVAEVCDSPIPKVGQNFTYDVFWLLDRMKIKMRNYLHDTRLLHHALYPELPKDLGFMGARYESVAPWKTMKSHGKGGTEKRDD